MFEALVFYVFGFVILASALCVITARNPVHAALFLVLAFFTSSAIWLLLRAEFLAITLVLVYVGAVMVLFLFVVMMLDINLERLREGFWQYLPLGAAVGLLMAFEIAAVILLVAIIAAIALTLRRRKDVRGQDPSQQAKVRREDRVRLVTMPSEKDL